MHTVVALFPAGQPRPHYRKLSPLNALVLDFDEDCGATMYLDRVHDPIRYLREIASAASALAAVLEQERGTVQLVPTAAARNAAHTARSGAPA